MCTKIIFFLCFIYYVNCKNTKSLTESLGQEVIEIASPVKELPQELEEEPSVEDDDSHTITSTTIQVATTKDSGRRSGTDYKTKDIDKIDGVKPDDEEARIEKELAELYKDTSDYKSDGGEVFKETNATQNITKVVDKPVARARTSFKFQPNANNANEIEKFRTSVDDISCEKNKLVATTAPNSANSTYAVAINFIILLLITSLLK